VYADDRDHAARARDERWPRGMVLASARPWPVIVIVIVVVPRDRGRAG